MAEKLTDEQLGAIVAQQIALAKAHDKHEREASRAKALDYYLGNMDQYVPPEVNRSKVVSRDVADTVGWMLPGIMRVFTASDRMAVAEPVGPEDLQFAGQATDGLNYVFWKDNRGYEIVYAATWDALVTKKAIIKTYYDDTPVYATSFHSGLTEGQRARLLEADDNGNEPEVLAHTVHEGMIEGPDGVSVPVSVYDLKIKRQKYAGRFVIECIPPEEFLIDGDAIYTDEAAFTDHWQQKTRSDLVAMGYGKEDVEAIPAATKTDTSEAQARDSHTETNATDQSMELVDYHECYIRVDVDGDGEAELVRACYGGGDGGKLLDWEVWEDEHPFDDIPCEPIPHRWDARSAADETIDIQDIKTVLTRQMLNNTYWVNHPQQFVAGKVKNPEALTDSQFGQPVFGEAGTTVSPLQRPYIGDKALMALAHFDEVRQSRTGVGRQSMALDPEALQNQTAEAARNNRDASYSQVELIARNMAEWGWKKVFRKLLRLMIKHQDYRRVLMLNNKPVEIDPRFWNVDMDVTINVGLGTGSRDRDLMMLRQVLETQLMLADRFMASSAVDDAIDLLPKIIETMVKMAEAAGIRNPEDFYPEYTEDKVAALKKMAAERAQQPDPKVQLEQERAKADIAIQQEKTQAAAQNDANKLTLEQIKAQNELVIERERMAGELQLKREQLSAEIELKREQLIAELQLKRELGLLSAQTQVATSQVRPGGDPG